MLSLYKGAICKAIKISARNISVSHGLRKNLYESLGLTREATQSEIKNAYFELSKIYHPDKIAATDENLARFREISAAYEVLGNENSRRLYDKGLIGDFKRPGMDDMDIKDPIIKFYQQRQDLSKDIAKSVSEMESFSSPSAQLRAKPITYQKSEIKLSKALDPTRNTLYFCLILAYALLFLSNFEGTPSHTAWKKVFG